MKTQINGLLSGHKFQLLNKEIDYSVFPQGTSHNGHAGSPYKEVDAIYAKVTQENPFSIDIELKGKKYRLQANWSLSGKSCTYSTEISVETFVEVTGLVPAKNRVPSIIFSDANNIRISNGKNSHIYVCPTLIKIL
jgi:hypothetical protein